MIHLLQSVDVLFPLPKTVSYICQPTCIAKHSSHYSCLYQPIVLPVSFASKLSCAWGQKSFGPYLLEQKVSLLTRVSLSRSDNSDFLIVWSQEHKN